MRDTTQQKNILLDIATKKIANLLNTYPEWKLYAFIDPMGINENDETSDPSSLFTQLDITQHNIPLVHASMQPNKRPYLFSSKENHAIAYDSFSQYVIEQMIEQALHESEPGEPRLYPLCALLLTPMNSDLLASSLAESAIVRHTNGKEEILRYWDPRASWQLATINSLNNLLAQKFAGHWVFVNGYGQLECFTRLQPFTPAVLSIDHQTQQLAQRAIERSKLFDYALCRTHSPLIDIQQHLDAELEIARMQGLQGAARIHFASKRYTLGTPIECSSTMQKFFHDLNEHGIDYMELQKEFEDEDWAKIATEARQAQLGETI